MSLRQYTQKQEFRHVLEVIIDLSNTALFFVWLVLTIGFAILYWLMAQYVPEHSPTLLTNPSPLINLANSLYFSIITATSTGYGDIVPQGYSKLFVSAQAILSLSTFAILITKLVSRNQDYALQQVQRMTSEESLHNLFEEMFLIRKDCDRFMQEIEEHQTLPDKHWNDLLITYERFQVLYEEVPSFYTKAIHFYSIDPRREKLLIEAVHRTLDRIVRFVDTMDRHAIDWKTRDDYMEKFEELLETTVTTFQEWTEHIPEERRDRLQQIEHDIEQLQSLVEDIIDEA
ncbi:hypothetical protein COU77_04240 [Candidatus Peregrinibacteria bacterium CG10_big_fil_rev_8_21_14_0_10_49_16]|nr:MAG: hypothetical protein COW95_01555 [Candidatus Peregrinibacteria bacterium CG22_combo_CG10-13_8_21_14_all_49_11]PIR51703.1 MAG: hypothetical protein COU77_04240 [Candidatus Peregrinibacteria bacterium CG10_big_fil_rev_8_21_14_0_10_49_16]